MGTDLLSVRIDLDPPEGRWQGRADEPFRAAGSAPEASWAAAA
jgi:hypothetical protein